MSYTITPIGISKKKLKEIWTNRVINRPFDIWKNEVDKVSSKDCPAFCWGFELDSTYGTTRKWFVVMYEISDTFSDVGSSIASVFKGDNKPGFAKGNVKYEEISQEEKDAADKRSQEGIGKVDHSPEATAARIAELNRQHSSYYKQKPDIKDDKSKEPAKIDDKSKVEPLKADIKPPVETKEQAHVKEMYKKFGLETFNDYNTRISAEVKQSHASIKDVKKDHATITSQDVKQPKPVEQPKAAEPIKPATPPPAAPAPVSKDVTLKDLHEALMQLNKTMTQMVHHTDTISNNSHKQIKATKSLSDNRLG